MFFEILDLCTQVRDLYENTRPDDRPSLLQLDKFKRVVIRAYTYLGKAPTKADIAFGSDGDIITSWVVESGKFVEYTIPKNGTSSVTYRLQESCTRKDPDAETLSHLLKVISADT